MSDDSRVPIHQWTHDEGYVLLVKVVNPDGTSYGGFQWPDSGPVAPAQWSREPTCNSGGLFGWPWGLHINTGKIGRATDRWIVFRAKPSNVIAADGKAKAVPGEDGELPEVLFAGSMAAAMAFTMRGRVAWIEACSRGSASATGHDGSASASGDGGSTSASGYGGSASASGYGGSASATGTRGSASATGTGGSASATGHDGSASATGPGGIASASGTRGSASATGTSGSASASGDGGSASATGTRGSASATGTGGSASATGHDGSASATGPGGIAASSYRAQADEEGAFVIRWHDGDRWRFAFGAVGEDGIEAGVWYRVVEGGDLVAAEAPDETH